MRKQGRIRTKGEITTGAKDRLYLTPPGYIVCLEPKATQPRRLMYSEGNFRIPLKVVVPAYQYLMDQPSVFVVSTVVRFSQGWYVTLDVEAL